MIYKQVHESEFIAYLSPTFSQRGASLVFQYLEDLDGNLLLDPVAIRSEWSEWYKESFLDEFSGGMFDIEEIIEEVRESAVVLHNEDYSVIVINE